ncbi:hypothetical protein ACRAWD_11090 [Caulobacter segnis]
MLPLKRLGPRAGGRRRRRRHRQGGRRLDPDLAGHGHKNSDFPHGQRSMAASPQR